MYYSYPYLRAVTKTGDDYYLLKSAVAAPILVLLVAIRPLFNLLLRPLLIGKVLAIGIALPSGVEKGSESSLFGNRTRVGGVSA